MSNHIMTFNIFKNNNLPAKNHIFKKDNFFDMEVDDIQSIINNKLKDCRDLTLYLEQLSPLTLEVCSYCYIHNIALTLLYYDRSTGECYPEEFLSRHEARYRQEILELESQVVL